MVALGAAGAPGRTTSSGRDNDYFGRGGRVYTIIPVQPQETLYIVVGGQGSSMGGYNGGAKPGHDGGGYFGGGGSSYVEPSAQNTHMWRGWKTATSNGLVVLSWSEAAPLKR